MPASAGQLIEVRRQVIENPFAAMVDLRRWPVACVAGEISDLQGAVYPEEAALVATAVAKRKRQFAAGRNAARRALAILGEGRAPIARGSSGEPLWPNGVVGSITHTDILAAAAVARHGDIVGIGIDLETGGELSPELLPHVLSLAELEVAADVGPRSAGLLGKMTFAAKEAIYKCVCPLDGTFFDFLDVAVRFNGEGTRFSAIALKPLSVADAIAAGVGFLTMTDATVAAVCLLPASHHHRVPGNRHIPRPIGPV